MKARIAFFAFVIAISTGLLACGRGQLLSRSITPTFTPTLTPTPELTPTKTPKPSPTKNPNGFNGYWLSPIDKGTNAYIKTYGNVCAMYQNGTNKNCIQNWKGDKGEYPKDFYEVMVCPFHTFGWDFIWDRPGEKVYAVQGGMVLDIRLDGRKPGVRFFIVDEKTNGRRYAADYGHVNGNSLVENGIIS
ncbi:MAG: hypothetical protein MUO64_14005 [Anaerolineales bacterium]|nr:hypothetical protein [Anaerolineales bacterium]